MQTAKILLVDDDASQRKLNRLRLEDAGYRVDAAENAEAALVQARKSSPDLIVSDVLMGEVDGFGFCRKLDADPALADIPVLLLSAHYGTEADVELARRVGAWTLLRRTPTFETELAAVKTCLRQRQRSGRRSRHVDAVDTYEQHLRSSANQMSRLVESTRVAEQRALALFDHASDLIAILSSDGKILEANLTWEPVLGVAREELIGKHITDLGLGQDNLDAFWRQGVARGALQETMKIRRLHDGTSISVQFSLRVIETDSGAIVLAIGRDITEQVESNRKVAATEALYRSMIEQSPDVLFRADVNYQIEYASPNSPAILGVCLQDVFRTNPELWRSRVHSEDLPTYLVALERAYAERAALDIEFRFRRPDNDKWIWLHLRMSPVTEGDRLMFVGSFSDVSQRRQLEHGLREAQKMEAIGLLTGGIAHDFNNLLAVIVANSGFLMAELADNDPRRSDAEEIEAAATRAAALTRQLLAFSRRQVLEMSIVELAPTVDGLGKMLRRLIGEDIELAIVAGDADPVRADVGQLEQVIVNLVVNARDALPAGGRISIETSNITVGADSDAVGVPPGDYVMLAVSDTGMGMTPETKQHLFEPFFTTKERGRGTGLGLSTCYGIVQQSGGYICVHSELGKGTVFNIYLPPVARTAMPRARRHSMTRLRGTETVLLIEDEAQVRAAIARMLDEQGYRVLTAQNAAEALAHASAQAIDLIISDVVMPGTSGPEVIAQLRAVSPRAVVLMISGYTDHMLLRSNIANMNAPILQKPFSPRTLGHKVREILDARPTHFS